jgi:hypothetical protein
MNCATCKETLGNGPTWCRECGQHNYRLSIAQTAADGRLLMGHTSPETAYVVDDYPYGFRLRCSIRYWLEYKKSHGYRFVSQTSNPKKPGTVWNKPKAGTYVPFAVMVLDTENHVTYHSAQAGGWTEDATLDAIIEHYAPALTEDHLRELRYIRATNRANELITVTVKVNSDEPRQTLDEQREIWGKAVRAGYVINAREESDSRTQ